MLVLSPEEQQSLAAQQKYGAMVQQSLFEVEGIARIADMPCAEMRIFQGESGRAKLQAMHQQAKANAATKGWSEIGSQTGRDGYVTRILKGKTGGSDVQCFVATSTMNAAPRAVYELLKDNSRIKEYNELFDRYEVLEKVGPKAAIGWAGYKAVFPTSAREFVTLTAWNEGGGSGGGTEGPWWVIASKSITPSQSDVVGAPRRGYTRGTIECAGFVVRWSPAFLEENDGIVPAEVATEVEVPVGKHKTQQRTVYHLRGVKPGVRPRTVFTSICQSSPGGSVPISLVNSLAATAPYKVIKGLKKIVEA
jgi:hypothetical protein